MRDPRQTMKNPYESLACDHGDGLCREALGMRCDEAGSRVDVIAALRADNARLRAALETALELQEGVEEARQAGYGSPKNTLVWMEDARASLDGCK
jgi:hypothetical protein